MGKELSEFYERNYKKKQELLKVVNCLDKVRISMLCESGLATPSDVDEVDQKNIEFFELNTPLNRLRNKRKGFR